ncbi:MAG: hypothetical protein WKF92_09415 [Pyrinomonadaceae bacterium]
MKFRTNASRMALGLFFAALFFAGNVSASHSWNNYHWARTSNPFYLKVVDSNTTDWDSELDSAMFDWSGSSVLDMINGTSDDTSRIRKRCPMVSGQVRSCNASYGFNGWLGLASINISGSHITQGSSKMNDSYFNGGGYNATNRRHVMCQEIGHTLGLGHTSEDGSDQNTCMDYSNDLGNPSPNQHDYDQLSTTYSHLDATTTVGFSAFVVNEFGDDPDAEHNWGRLVSQSANGRSSYYERDNMNGTKKATHVFWTQEAADRCHGCDHRYDH